MNSLNQLILEGTVVKDAEIKDILNGKFSTVTVATKRFYKGRDGEPAEEVSYFEVVGYGDFFADLYSKKCKKGNSIRIVGRMKQERWKDEDGKSHSKIIIIAEHIDGKEKEEEICL